MRISETHMMNLWKRTVFNGNSMTLSSSLLQRRRATNQRKQTRRGVKADGEQQKLSYLLELRRLLSLSVCLSSRCGWSRLHHVTPLSAARDYRKHKQVHFHFIRDVRRVLCFGTFCLYMYNGFLNPGSQKLTFVYVIFCKLCLLF